MAASGAGEDGSILMYCDLIQEPVFQLHSELFVHCWLNILGGRPVKTSNSPAEIILKLGLPLLLSMFEENGGSFE